MCVKQYWTQLFWCTVLCDGGVAGDSGIKHTLTSTFPINVYISLQTNSKSEVQKRQIKEGTLVHLGYNFWVLLDFGSPMGKLDCPGTSG